MRPIAIIGAAGAVAVGAFCAFQGHAADLGPLYPAPPVYAEPDTQYEFGTGWYLRGDAGWGQTTREHILEDLPTLTASDDFTGGIGAGYRWNSWFRTDLSLNYEGFQHVGGVIATNQTCPYAIRGQYNATGNTGFFWDPSVGTCTGRGRGDLLKTDVMVGGYVDIGTWAGLTPYIGAGVGFARIDTWHGANYYTDSTGAAYSADLTAISGYPLVWEDAQGNTVRPVVPTTGKPVAFAPQNWAVKTHNTKYNFAWSLMGGVAYAVDDHLSIDVGYRYVNLGTYTDAAGAKKTLDAQQVRVGVRYAID